MSFTGGFHRGRGGGNGIDSINANQVIETSNRQFVTSQQKQQIDKNKTDIEELKNKKIYADEIIETSNRVFVSSNEKGQLQSMQSELASHAQRITDLENAPPPVTTDEKVKMSSNDTEGYLIDKIDGITIYNNNGKLSVRNIEGLTATIQELNLLQGATKNIQAQINALTSVGNFTTSVDTYADLINLQDMQANDMVIVIEDETRDNSSTIYIYSGSQWTFAGEFKSGELRNFSIDPIDLETETIGYLPKERYEKQNASETPIIDSAGNFNSTTVEGALQELFTYANSIKSGVANAIGNPLLPSDTVQQLINKINLLKVDLANAITHKGIPAYPYNTLQEMANKILSIPNIEISGILKKTAKINIKAPYTMTVKLSEPLQVDDLSFTVLEYVSDNKGVVHYTSNYNNGNADNFDYDEGEIVFDGVMRLRDEWLLNFEYQEDNYYITEEIDFNEYSDIDSISLTTLNNGNVGIFIKALKGKGQIVRANGDISLFGVESIDKLDVVSLAEGNGIAKIAISFDSGVTWWSYNNGEWIEIDENNFEEKGMTASTVNALTDSELSILRNDSNYVRFAYYLKRPTFDDDAQHIKLEMTVSMFGYNVLADTKDYSINYDEQDREIQIEIFKNGTYSVNYVDGY